MKPIPVTIRQIGNSQGIVIPKTILMQLGLDSGTGAEMTVENDALVLRASSAGARSGWAEAAQRIAAATDDALVLGDFSNEDDGSLRW